MFSIELVQASDRRSFAGSFMRLKHPVETFEDDRTAAASGNSLRYDGMRDRANSKADITRVIHEEPAFAELFIAHLLARNSRVEEDLVDRLFNSSETPGTDPSASGQFWQGRAAEVNYS